MNSEAKLARTLKRFNAKIGEGSYYELLLTLQTIVNRYIPTKNYGDAIELLYQASLTLLEHNQISSAYDSTIRIIEIFKLQLVDESIFSKEQLPLLLQLLNKFPNNDPSLKALSKEAISYSIQVGSYKLGDPLLNYLFAQKFLLSGNSDNYELAENLLVVSGSNNPNSLDLYVEYLTQLFRTGAFSIDVLAGRLVLGYLYIGNIHFATEGLRKLITSCNLQGYTESGQLLVFEQENSLLNFLQLLIEMIRVANNELVPAYKALFNRYKQSLVSLNLVAQYDFIGQTYFNVTMVLKQNNMMLNLLSGFLGGN